MHIGIGRRLSLFVRAFYFLEATFERNSPDYSIGIRGQLLDYFSSAVKSRIITPHLLEIFPWRQHYQVRPEAKQRSQLYPMLCGTLSDTAVGDLRALGWATKILKTKYVALDVVHSGLCCSYVIFWRTNRAPFGQILYIRHISHNQHQIINNSHTSRLPIGPSYKSRITVLTPLTQLRSASPPAPILGYSKTLLVDTCCLADKLPYCLTNKKFLPSFCMLTSYRSPASYPVKFTSKRHRTACAIHWITK